MECWFVTHKLFYHKTCDDDHKNCPILGCWLHNVIVRIFVASHTWVDLRLLWQYLIGHDQLQLQVVKTSAVNIADLETISQRSITSATS